MLQIDILHVKPCPNYEPAEELVREVANALNVPVDVTSIEIRTVAEARQEGFRGSPTIRVNGRDVEPESDGACESGLACRTYRGQGIPPRAWVERAIREATDMA